MVVEILVGGAAGVLRDHARQVGSGAEGLFAGAGQDHHPHRGVGLRPGNFPPEAGDDLPGHGVAPLWTVDRQGEHRAVVLGHQVARGWQVARGR
jgi:hypothetical protein